MKRFRLVVFQRRLPSGSLRWSTVGLGQSDLSVTSATVPAARRRMTELLKARLAEIDPAGLARFHHARGLRLETPRLALELRGLGGRRRFVGRFPLVVEQRSLGGGDTLPIAYHPERPRDWMPVHDEALLASQAAAFLSRAWADLDADDLEDLAGAKSARLRVIEVSARAPGLLDHLPDERRGVWADLEVDATARGGEKKKRRPPSAPKILPKVGSDLTVRAVDASLPVGEPRSPWRERMQLLLGPHERTSVLVVGPPGVGKRTLVNRWVADLAEAEGFALHQNLDRLHHVWSVAGKRIIAGMMYVGDWEQRCVELLEDCAAHQGILFVEDVAAWGRIGRTRDSDRCLADVFRGPIARGELTLVATCTAEELARLEDDAPAFASLFIEVHLPAAGRDATLEMLVREGRRLEEAHECELSPSVYPAILDELVPVIPNAALPGAALDILRAAARDNPDDPVGAEDVIYAAAARYALPPEAVLGTTGRSHGELAARVLGQEQAVRAAAEVIDRVRARLDDPRRPYGVLLLSGPTGTGKTELAKAIASVLYSYGDGPALTQIDMSELTGPDAVERLIGAPWRPEGRLTQPIIERPFQVVLLDEIEKVHPSALNLLLQVLDEGRLTDASGRVAAFSRAVVVMTSNLGATDATSLGFGGAPDARALEHAVVRAAEGFFPPELFNRIDQVVAFKPLSRDVARDIAQLQLGRLLKSPGLIDRHVHASATPAVLDRAVAEGYDPTLGARPLRRWLEREVGGLLSDWLSTLTAAGYHLAELDAGPAGLTLRTRTLAPAAPLPGVAGLADLFEDDVATLKAQIPAAIARLNRQLGPAARDARSTRLEGLLGQRSMAEPARPWDAGPGRAAAGGGGGAAGSVSPGPSSERSEALSDRGVLGQRSMAEPARPWDAGPGRAAAGGGVGAAGSVSPGPSSERSEARSDEGVLAARDDGDEAARARRDQAIYYLDAVERQLEGLRRRLSRLQQSRTAQAHELATALAQVGFLERAAEHVEDVGRHEVVVELVAVGGRSFPGAGLLGAMVKGYRLERTEVEGFASARKAGPIAHQAVEHAANGADAVVLRVGGLDVLSLLEGEAGYHAWESLAGSVELVRVAVRPATDADDDGALVRAAVALAAAGAERPDDAVAPLVRQVSFDPRSDRKTTAPAEVTDHRLELATVMAVHDYDEIVARCVALRAGRGTSAGDGREGAR